MISGVVCMVLLLVAGASAYPKELIGTFAGSCQQIASTNSTGMNAICTGSSKIVISYPYTITYSVVKSKTIKGGMDMKIQQTQGEATNMLDGKAYYIDAYNTSASYALAHATTCGEGVYCITSRPAALGPDAFMAQVIMVGTQKMYIEQGMWTTPTNLPVPGGCAGVMDSVNKFFCNDVNYSYYCSGFKV